MGDGARGPTIRSLTTTVYAPTFLFAAGQGAVIPLVALAAKEVGASAAVAGLTVAARGIGTMAFDVPAGTLVARYGERRAMALGTAMLLVALVGCVLSTSPLPFGAFMFLMGCGWAVWLLARLTYVSEVMPLELRGRALSTLGGVNRVGSFVGPFLGAVAVTVAGIDGAYLVHIALAIAGWIVLALVPDLTGAAGVHEHPPVTAIVREHRSVFLTAGVGAMAISVLRASRHAILPLWADHIGLDAAAVGIIFGLASAMDMTLFYPAGAVSDRFGRKHVAIPTLVFLSLGFLLVPLTSSFTTLAAVAVLMGFGNGLGSGIVMTLGADFAPPNSRATFLGVWRTVSDVGMMAGPLLAAGVVATATLSAASLVTGGVGLAGAAVVALRMPEPLRRSARPTG